MSVTLPALPGQARVTPTYRDFSGRLVPPSGGQEQRVARLGDRWALRFTLPPMAEAQALAFVAAQTKAATEGATLRGVFPRRGAAPTGMTGIGAVNSTIVAASAVADVVVGMFFSFESGGHAYLHQVTGISGGNLSIGPRLRAALNGALNFTAPVIEGFLDSTITWDAERLAHSGVTFTISEDR
jgi:hypothetical protein